MPRPRLCLRCELSFVGDEPICPSCARQEYRDGTPWPFGRFDKEQAREAHDDVLRHEEDALMAEVQVAGPQEVRLRRFAAALETAVGSEVLDPECRVRTEDLLDVLGRSVRFQVRGFIWAEDDCVRRFEFKVPATWWQHFKERFFRGWMRRRWPVRYQVHSVDVEAIYPEFKQQMPRREAGLAVLMLSHPQTSFWTEGGSRN
jgi:hypothetical protein